MPNTYSYTNTYTFARADVVLAQFKNALGYAKVLSKEKTELLLDAIREKKISSMGIYAYNSDDKRVMEVVIKVDWDKHQQMVSTFGDIFEEGQAGFNYKKVEAAETKVLVNKMVKSANENGLKLSTWVITSKTITGEERTNLLKKIGFDGGKPEPWIAEPTEKLHRRYQTIEEMEISYESAGRIK